MAKADEVIRVSTRPTFVVGGRGRAADAVRSDCLAEIQRAIEAKYVQQLSRAGTLRRFWIRMKMNREIKQALAAEVEKRAPRGGLYGVR